MFEDDDEESNEHSSVSGSSGESSESLETSGGGLDDMFGFEEGNINTNASDEEEDEEDEPEDAMMGEFYANTLEEEEEEEEEEDEDEDEEEGSDEDSGASEDSFAWETHLGLVRSMTGVLDGSNLEALLLVHGSGSSGSLSAMLNDQHVHMD